MNQLRFVYLRSLGTTFRTTPWTRPSSTSRESSLERDDYHNNCVGDGDHGDDGGDVDDVLQHDDTNANLRRVLSSKPFLLLCSPPLQSRIVHPA